MTTPAPDTPTLLKGMYAAEAEYLAAGGPGTASFEIMAPFFAPDVVLQVEQEFLATGATAVVLTQIHARARSTGTKLDFPILQTLQIRDGRVAEVRPFYWDTAAIAAACA